MTDRGVVQSRSDWVGSSYLLVWGLPKILLAVGFFLPDPWRIPICAGALAWMGIACLANARRCGRTHCLFMGPFYLLMGAAVPIHGFRLVSFGDNGWLLIGASTAVGVALLWIVPERLFGAYIRRRAVADG